jgi:hypothetical protein
MPQTTILPIPLGEPIALLDATLLFIIQLFLAQHPDLLAPPESNLTQPPPGLRHARRVLDAVRELHLALQSYAALRQDASRTQPYVTAHDDDFPF